MYIYIYTHVFIPYIPWYAVYFGHVLFQHDLRIRSAEAMNVESFRLKDPLEWTVSEVGDFLASILQGDPRGPGDLGGCNLGKLLWLCGWQPLTTPY